MFSLHHGWIAASSVLFIFLASSTVSYFLCWIKEIPFTCLSTKFIPSLENMSDQGKNMVVQSKGKENKKVNNPQDFQILSILAAGNTVCLTYLLETHSFISFEKNQEYVIYYLPIRLLMYLLFVEGCYYGIHRLLHLPPFYHWIHKKHHENYYVSPMDAFHLSLMETGLIVLNQNLPFFFLSFTFQEYLFLLYLYVTLEYLSHTNAFLDHHFIHHKYYKYNYCIVFPFFDWMFGTYKE
jgi:sterol desaturase/sphingolipid hydroxylase (fatty acid hydroxylase superfamily)